MGELEFAHVKFNSIYIYNFSNILKIMQWKMKHFSNLPPGTKYNCQTHLYFYFPRPLKRCCCYLKLGTMAMALLNHPNNIAWRERRETGSWPQMPGVKKTQWFCSNLAQITIAYWKFLWNYYNPLKFCMNLIFSKFSALW